MNQYLRLVFEVAAFKEDVLSADLWSLEILGTHSAPLGPETVRVEAFLWVEAETEDRASGPRLPKAQAAQKGSAEDLPPFFRELLADSPRLLRCLVSWSIHSDEDWQANYRQSTLPLEVSSRLVVDPGEVSRRDSVHSEFFLHLPARTAFGTGSHESTQLVVRFMEELPLNGQRVLDVGSGSGILSFFALQLGASIACGFDFDVASSLMSGEYRHLNGLYPHFFAGRGAALAPQAKFDWLLVNVLPHRILPDMPFLSGRLIPGGQAIFSGLTKEVEATTQAVIEQLGFSVVEERWLGEWLAWRAVLEQPA